MYYLRILIPFLPLIFLSSGLIADEEGYYYLKNYYYREYGGESQNWAICQDKRNIIYIANNVGVIEYDGYDWRHISINNSYVRCLDVDSVGCIWVGGQDELGYLAADSVNNLVYHSLVNLIPNEYLPLGLVRQVYCKSSTTYFSTSNLIIRINADLSINVWKSKTTFTRSFFVDGTLFIAQKDFGLLYIEQDSLHRAEGCRQFVTSSVYSMLPYDSRQILVGTQSDGFFLYDFISAQKSDGSSAEDDFVKPFATSDDEFFRKNWIYSGANIDDSTFAFGTYRGGVVFLDKQGRITRRLNSNNGLQDDAVWFLFVDAQNGLWVALNDGISYTPIKSMLSKWSEKNWLNGVPQSVTRFNDNIYVSTNKGVFKHKDSGFELLREVNHLCYDFEKFTYKEKDYLLLASMGGIYVSEGDGFRMIENGGADTDFLLKSKMYPNIIYAGTGSGVGVIYYQNGVFKYLGALKETVGEVKSIVETPEGDLWYSYRFNGVCFIDIVNPYQLVSEKPVLYKPYHSAKYRDIVVSSIDGNILVSSEGGLSRFSSSTKSFVPDSTFGLEFAQGSKSIKILGQDLFGSVWFESYTLSPSRKIEKATKQDDGTYVRDWSQYKSIPLMGFTQVMVEPNGVEWITATDGLYRCNTSVANLATCSNKVLIRKVIANQEVVYNGASTSVIAHNSGHEIKKHKRLVIEYDHNSLQIQFATTAIWQHKQVQYSYMLEGYNSEWSEWTEEHRKEYTNLPFGIYKFRVKSRSSDSVESQITDFEFQISRPWFRKWYSYLMYIIVSVAIAKLLTNINSRRLRMQNSKLQKFVEERTEEFMQLEKKLMVQNSELELQKAEILSQRDELLIRNRRISDSIQHASTIQQALLPNLNQVLKGFGEHFIIYRPKDMVSGDFYWATQVDDGNGDASKTIIAVVDCKGYGVPCAFMSQLGSSLLSEVVNERKITSPDLILEELNNLVIQALRQNITDGFEGMDMTICMLERKSADIVVVTFAGANRSLYYFRSDDSAIQTIRGNGKPIGSALNGSDIKFKSWCMPFHHGDMIVLCSDGISVQNNQSGQEYTHTGLHRSLFEAKKKPIAEVENNILKHFDEFKQGESQFDDLTVLGIRF